MSLREVRALQRAYVERPAAGGGLERMAAQALVQARRTCLETLVPAVPELPLDEVTWRLGAAVHNLLALAHPAIATGPGAEARVRRVAIAATELARVGPPASLAETLARHSLLSRLWEIERRDHTVRFWLGTRTFVGRQPPSRVLAWPRLRGVQVETVRRVWLRDVGVRSPAQPAFEALTEASPLGEALAPLRLEPVVSWPRLLTVLRFPTLARLAAGRMVQLGVGVTGDALAEALLRLAFFGQTGAAPSIAFALNFLAHLVWLDFLFNDASLLADPASPTWPVARADRGILPDPDASFWANFEKHPVPGDVGRELAVLVGAAAQVNPSLVWPADVARESSLGRAFAHMLTKLFERHQIETSPHWRLARELAGWADPAAPALPPEPEGMGYKGGPT